MLNLNKREGFAFLLALFAVVVAITAAVGGVLYFGGHPENGGQVACTQEAKLCPDGSSVGRTGPNCEFAACPTPVASTTVDISNWQTYRNDKYGFKVKYPSDWIVKENKDNGLSVSFQTVGQANAIYPLHWYNLSVQQTYFNSLDEWFQNEFKDRSSGDAPSKKTIIFNNYSALNISDPLSEGGCSGNNVIIINNGFSYQLPDPTCEKDQIITEIGSTFKFISTSTTGTGTLAGQVTIGPNCPVERIDNPCLPSPEAYTSREFSVTQNGKTLGTFHANASGTYSVSLAPGTYVITSAKTGIGYMSKDLPATVIIKSGETATLNIDVDTGIR